MYRYKRIDCIYAYIEYTINTTTKYSWYLLSKCYSPDNHFDRPTPAGAKN
jgi:hypothetical protein